MRKQKAVICYTAYTDKDFAAMAQNVINKMTNNPDFLKPDPPLATVSASLNAFTKALEKSYEGTKQDTVFKKEKRIELDQNLTRLAEYVNLIADGDLTKLTGSGFPLTKLPTPVGILPAPKYIRVTDIDNNGELEIEISRVQRATGYLVLYSEVPAPTDHNEWLSAFFSKPKGLLPGLKSETKYVFKAAAVSSESSKRNLYNYTPPVERITQ